MSRAVEKTCSLWTEVAGMLWQAERILSAVFSPPLPRQLLSGTEASFPWRSISLSICSDLLYRFGSTSRSSSAVFGRRFCPLCLSSQSPISSMWKYSVCVYIIRYRSLAKLMENEADKTIKKQLYFWLKSTLSYIYIYILFCLSHVTFALPVSCNM